MLSLILAVVVMGAPPKAPKEPPKVLTAADVAKEIEGAISAIDRVKLTQAKAGQALKSVLAAFAGKRHKVSVTFTVSDIADGGDSGMSVTVTCDDPMLSAPTNYSLPKNDKKFLEIANADKGDKITFTGTAVAFYTTDGSYDLPRDSILISMKRVAAPPERQLPPVADQRFDFLDAQDRVGVYLTNFKVTVGKPKKEE